MSVGVWCRGRESARDSRFFRVFVGVGVEGDFFVWVEG